MASAITPPPPALPIGFRDDADAYDDAHVDMGIDTHMDVGNARTWTWTRASTRTWTRASTRTWTWTRPSTGHLPHDFDIPP